MRKKTALKPLDIMLWAVVVVITLAAFYATYFYTVSTPVKAIVWVSWMVLVTVPAIFTTQGKQVIAFGKESKVELQKVVWPTRHETVQTTTIVMVMVALTGVILWCIDSGMMWIIGKLTHLG